MTATPASEWDYASIDQLSAALRSPSGLPIGVQIIGPYLGDRTTIAFATLLERELGGFTPPSLDGIAMASQ